MAAVAPAPAHLYARVAYAEAAAPVRPLALPEVPGRHTSHAERRDDATRPTAFIATPPAAPAAAPEARPPLISTFLIQLVADEQRGGDAARAGPLEHQRAHAAYRLARTTAGAAALARIGVDASELAAKPGTTLDTFA